MFQKSLLEGMKFSVLGKPLNGHDLLARNRLEGDLA